MADEQIIPSSTTTGQTLASDLDENSEKDGLESITYGDLYVLGKLWVELLKTGLLGTTWKLIPVVEAAKPPPPPKRPPAMRYKDLPVYDSPHYEYKEYVEDQEKCPQAKDKLIHQTLLPRVKSFRKSVEKNWCDFKTEFASFKKEVKTSVNNSKNDFKAYMRHPDNMTTRQVVLALGGLTGLYIGSGGGIPRKIFFTGCGLLAAGSLCFPKETDETFREFSYTAGKFFLSIYNRYCRKDFKFRERVPCTDELPGPPKYRKVNVCPKK